MILTGDYAIVQGVILQYLPRFEAHKFELREIAEATVAGENRHPVFRFFNDQIQVRLDLAFSAAINGLNGGFTAHFEDRKRRLLDVEVYLKSHGHQDLSKLMTYRDPNTNIGAFADSFLKVFCSLFDTDLKPIVDGQTFEETPVDWLGYR